METLDIKTSPNYIIAKSGLAICFIVIMGLILCNCTGNPVASTVEELNQLREIN